MPRGGKREGAGPKPRRLIIEITEDQYITGIEHRSGYEFYVSLNDNSLITISVSSGGPRIIATLDKMRGAKVSK